MATHVAGVLEIQMLTNIARVQSDTQQIKGMYGSAMKSVESSVAMAKTALASLGLGIGLQQVIALTDAYTKYTAQLKLASQGNSEYAQAMSDVRRISTLAQADLQSTGVLYARIKNAVGELGLSQQRVANLTETVTLALKASGATTAESASAMLQLSQAFASGVLRGQEFNAVNEAAPRLMKALADGIGVPVGALRKMAEEGKITSEVMAGALPRALEDLRREAAQVQTIGGAFTVLKNNVMEYVGATAQANGSVAVLTSAITALANNLNLVLAALAGIAAAKIGTFFLGVATAVYQKSAALVASAQAVHAERAASIAAAQADIARIESTLAFITADRAKAVAQLQSAQATLAATSAVGAHSAALRFNTAAAAANSVALTELAALGRLQAASTAQLAAAQTALATAQAGATGAATLGARALGLLGGPIGWITTALGLGVTAWMTWGRSAEDANKQALDATRDSAAEMIELIEKQNAKLRDRIALANTPVGAGLAQQDTPAVAALASNQREINRLVAEQNVLKQAGNDLTEVDRALLWALREESKRLSEQLRINVGLKADVENVDRAAKSAEWMGKYATNAEKLAKELDAARKALGGILPAELERRIREKFDTKPVKARVDEYEKLAKAADKFVESLEKEAAQLGLTAIQKKMMDAATVALTLKTDKERMAVMVTAKVWADAMAAQEDATAKARKEVEANAAAEKRATEITSAYVKELEDLAAQRAEMAAYVAATMSAHDASIDATQKLIEQTRFETTLMGKSSAERRIAIALRAMETAGVKLQAAEMQRFLATLAEVIKAQEDLVASDNALKTLTDFLDPARAQSFGDALTGAFGNAGNALGKLAQALDAYGRKEAEIEKMRQESTKVLDPIKRKEIEIALNEKSADAQVRAYGDMASAAAGFFETGSDGYNALMAVSKAFHAIELAGQLAEMIPRGINAVLNQGNGDPYSAFARMAAMAAIVAGLGVAIGGGAGGGGGGQTTAARQRAQGTGTVLGDADAKSQSLLNAIKEIEKTDKLGLTYSHDMLAALRAIQGSMSGLATAIFRTTGMITGTNSGVETGSVRNQGSLLLGALGIDDSWFMKWQNTVTQGLAGWFVGLIGKTTTEITDTGLRLYGRLAEMMRGEKIDQYTMTRTQTSYLGGLIDGKPKDGQVNTPVDDIARQLGLVFKGITDSVEGAAKALGLWTPYFREAMLNIMLTLNTVSFKDLKGQELTDALNAVLSAASDQIAHTMLPGFEEFQKVGEGYYETLIRVASTNEYVKNTMDALGLTLGLVGMDGITARLELAELAGGLENFGKITQDYYSKYYSPAEQYANTGANLGAEFGRLGVDMPTDPAGMRALIESIGTATPEARALTIELMKLAGVFYDYSTAVLGLDGQMHTLDETTRQHRDLEEELAVLNGTKTAQFVERSRRMAEAIDATSLATLNAIFVEEDRQAGLANQAEQNQARWDLEQELLDLTQTESEAMERQRSLRITELALREQELALAPGTLTALQRQIDAQTDLNAARAAEAAAMKATSDLEGRLGVLRGDYTQQELDRAREWQAAADGYDRALLTQIYAMEDAKVAAEELQRANETALNTEIELRGRLFELTHTESEVLERNRQIRLDELRILELTGNLLAGTLTSIQEQIFAQEDLNAATQAATAAISTFNNFFIGSAEWWNQQAQAAEDAAEAAAKAAADALKAAMAWSDHLTEWLNRNALGDLSPLTAQQQLLEAQRQYDLAKLGGDAGALTRAADMLLAADKAVEGFGGGYSALYAQIRDDLAGLAESGPVATVGEAQIVTAIGELRKEVTSELADAKRETARLLERLIEATREGSDDVSGAVKTGTTKQAAATEKVGAIDKRR